MRPTRPLSLLAGAVALWLTGCSGEPPQKVTLTAPEVGACRVLNADDVAKPSNDSLAVPCTKQHTSQTYHVGALDEADTWDDPGLAEKVYPVCQRRYMRFVGADDSLALRSVLTWAWFRPTEQAWAKGARWYRCDVVGGAGGSDGVASTLPLPTTAKGLLLGRPADRWMLCAVGDTVADSEKVPCDRKHTWRAVTTIVVAPDKTSYPGDRLVEVRSRDYCSDSVGAWMNYPVDYDYGYTWFHRAEWEAGNRRSVCWARTEQ